MSQFSKNGFTIIELMITVTVLSFGVIGIYAALTPLIAQTSMIASRFTASYLAQEGIEIVRNIRDVNATRGSSGWLGELSQCATPCQLDYKTLTLAENATDALKPYDSNAHLVVDSDGFYAYGLGQPTKFSRKVSVVQLSEDVALATVNVMWNASGSPSVFELQEYLYRFK